MMELLERPGYGSEMSSDSHCPQCGSHRLHHASVQRPPDITYHKCPVPTCGASVGIYVDRHGTICITGRCEHVACLVSLNGQIQPEFSIATNSG